MLSPETVIWMKIQHHRMMTYLYSQWVRKSIFRVDVASVTVVTYVSLVRIKTKNPLNVQRDDSLNTLPSEEELITDKAVDNYCKGALHQAGHQNSEFYHDDRGRLVRKSIVNLAIQKTFPESLWHRTFYFLPLLLKVVPPVSKKSTAPYDNLIIGLIWRMTSTWWWPRLRAAYETKCEITTGADWISFQQPAHWNFSPWIYLYYSREQHKKSLIHPGNRPIL